eukprot:scaffold149_cov315-Pinguiococcus_pyrenoidosus.AAC.62
MMRQACAGTLPHHVVHEVDKHEGQCVEHAKGSMRGPSGTEDHVDNQNAERYLIHFRRQA